MPRTKRGDRLKVASRVSDSIRDDFWPKQPSEADVKAAEQLLNEAAPYTQKIDLELTPADPKVLVKLQGLYRRGLEKLFKDKAWEFAPGRPDAGYQNDFYLNLDNTARDVLRRLCDGVAQCLMDLYRSEEEILEWYDELEIISMHFFLRQTESHLYAWSLPHHAIPDMTQYRTFLLTQTCAMFKTIGNTGRAQHLLCIADHFMQSNKCMPREIVERHFRISHHNRSFLLQSLHPDPFSKAPKKDSGRGFCCEGAWTKVSVKVKRDMRKRGNHGSFIWEGHLYVIGGTRNPESDVHYSDFWRLNLKQLEHWEFLCNCPLPSTSFRWQTFQNIRLYDDKAYLFWGEPEVHYYDLRTNKWESFITAFTPTDEDQKDGINDWPWKGNICFQSAQQFIQGRLLVFGGGHGDTRAGCNLLMELDLETKAWRRLSGFPVYQERNDTTLPPGRISPGSWVSKNQRKLYILFGESPRSQPQLPGDRFAPGIPWNHDDLWSWDVDDRQWRRERICGSPPAPRAYMGCVYNKKMDRVIVYGGSNIMNHHESPRIRKKSNSIVYSDAFVWQPAPTDNVPDYNGQYRWQQVICEGYPTHRAHHQLVCDSDTGKVYLYGGIAKTELTPSKSKSHLRAFGDVWQLHLDLSGGDFKSISRKDQARTATLGPWRRCFNCSKVGEWKECGGSCEGRAFFCGRDCLVQGWGEHKRLHGCRKR